MSTLLVAPQMAYDLTKSTTMSPSPMVRHHQSKATRLTDSQTELDVDKIFFKSSEVKIEIKFVSVQDPARVPETQCYCVVPRTSIERERKQQVPYLVVRGYHEHWRNTIKIQCISNENLKNTHHTPVRVQ